MLRIVAAGVTALFVTASPTAYAQSPASAANEPLSAADMGSLTDIHIKVVKAALQLTPDQEKYWPAIEDAIRTGAKDRQTRMEEKAQRLAELRDNPIQVLRNRDTVQFLQRRADALAQRAADLKKLADAWQPLYSTLSPEQRQRMAFLTVYTLRQTRNAVQQRTEDNDEED
jgi:Spy/CpxP family protein refolding chaperone